MKSLRWSAAMAVLTLSGAAVLAQPPASGTATPPAGDAAGAPRAAPRGMPPAAKLGEGPWDIKTEKQNLHVEVVVRGIDHPWGLAFLPNGDMLITQRDGKLRVVRKGVLDPNPVTGLLPVLPGGLGGLMDIALHPKFAQNHWVYMTYTKGEKDQNSTVAVMRGRWDGTNTLKDVKDIFVAKAWYGKAPLPVRCCGQGPQSGSYGSRIAFGKDGKLYMTSGDRNYGELAQLKGTHIGKILRLNDDGTVPRDNPFVGQKEWLPEIWTLGHRNPLGLTFNPVTGALWETEFGPRGGDELNIIEKGKNYGWITVTQGFHYNGEPAKGIKGVDGYTDPVIAFGPPSINPGNPVWVTGTRFPGWKGDLILPTMSRSAVRISFDASGRVATHQELMLQELKQRFRDSRMGPDGYIYILTDETDGALLRIKPGS
ncbi:MAG: PQQ-dependent sugar dehydrogenase [Sphingobium sp.]|nr:PQQ-dependent sugar dehydrogenase [Sphingobium sp.]